ncbi:hypothetical protein QBC38DRAFT_196265 [Podospora fimiseda]|uniref:SWR1-complex protein 3 domain-containing protein n=1 Tax=Podospora fimiseda TaxID=252190 RepID=A0AAN7H4J7_9PEZI|nr:hypothetical protein QBC38DRAFT_196265 [Podospora fimiseda]
MEKNLKRKLPARAAARSEQAAKRRNITPTPVQKSKSSTPTPAPEPEQAPAEDAPPPLPKAVVAGKPLPAVDSPQPDDLPTKDYQTVTESGVLSESLTRSRQTWITDGIFEKYWSKPIKKKGVVIEEPNNPPKESMTKLGQVTITIEPHVFEATMFAVKDPKPPAPPTPATPRPILQYGPPNGVMPPPPTPKPVQSVQSAQPVQSAQLAQAVTAPPASTDATKSQAKDGAKAQANQPAQPPTQSQAPPPVVSSTPALTVAAAAAQMPISQTPAKSNHITPPIPAVMPRPVASPRGMEAVLSPNTVTPQPPRPPVTVTPAVTHQPPHPPTVVIPATSTSANPTPAIPKPPITGAPAAVMGAPTAIMGAPAAVTGAQATINGAPTTVNSASAATAAGASGKAPPPPGTDPIIMLLAERAGTNSPLRDLMKKVAQGDASKVELERFQLIIDALAIEVKLRDATGPVAELADKLFVDGRSMRYFADEVRSILNIVLSSNPKQTSADLKPPVDSDPLVVGLVKEALDDMLLRGMAQRVGMGTFELHDLATLKATLDRVYARLREKQLQQQAASQISNTGTANQKPNGAPNGAASSPSTPAPQAQQALRSKGPPPPPKPDISAIVFEFTGGTGDRYLFPKYSILEQVPMPQGSGQQVLCSFLLVRRGSKSEYPQADPELDYYQPITIRLFTPTGRHLDHLSRVVAPQEEVVRYMDGVMDKMTRAEYILLAMRLPRKDGTETEDTDMGGTTNRAPPVKEKESEATDKGRKGAQNPMAGVLWATKPPRVEMRELSSRSRVYAGDAELDGGDEQYQRFISTVAGKGVQD